MDKILVGLVALALGLGTLFAARTARGDTIVGGLTRNKLATNQPGQDDTKTSESVPADDAPQGSSPLGLRNNNPFNLEYHNIGWQGETGSDGRFSIFDTSANGIRAGMINIHTKMTRDGLNTVRKLITRLSPAFENPTEDYVQYVSRRLGVAAEQPIYFSSSIVPLSKAIIQFENGSQPFTDVELAWSLAQTGKV